MTDGGDQFVEDLSSRYRRRGEGFKIMSIVGIDLHALRRGTQVGTVTGDHHEAEVIMGDTCQAAGGQRQAGTVGAGVLELSFLFDTAKPRQGGAGLAVALRIAGLSQLSRPTSEFVAIEMGVSAIGHVGEGAIVEVQ